MFQEVVVPYIGNVSIEHGRKLILQTIDWFIEQITHKYFF